MLKRFGIVIVVGLPVMLAVLAPSVVAAEQPRLVALAALNVGSAVGVDQQGHFQIVSMPVAMQKTNGSTVAGMIRVSGDTPGCNGGRTATDYPTNIVNCQGPNVIKAGTFHVTYTCDPGICQAGYDTVTYTITAVLRRELKGKLPDN